MHIRERLKEARLAAGLTTEEVGRRIGRSQSVVSRWEVGSARMPDWDVVMAWAEAVGLRLQVDALDAADPFAALRQLLTPDEAQRLVLALATVKKVS